MAAIQIPKSKSVSFNDYLYDIISNSTSSFATGWGFFVSIDEDKITPIKQTLQNNYTIKPVIKRKDSIKSFPSTSNLHSPDLQTTKLQTSKLQDIDEITETMFEMDLYDIESKHDSNINYNNYVVSKYNYNTPSNIYNNIKANIYFIGTIIIYGSMACIKTVIS